MELMPRLHLGSVVPLPPPSPALPAAPVHPPQDPQSVDPPQDPQPVDPPQGPQPPLPQDSSPRAPLEDPQSQPTQDPQPRVPLQERQRQSNPMLLTRRLSSMANLRQKSGGSRGHTPMQRAVSRSMPSRAGSRSSPVMPRMGSRSEQLAPGRAEGESQAPLEAEEEEEEEEEEELVGRALFLLSGENPVRVFLAKASELPTAEARRLLQF